MLTRARWSPGFTENSWRNKQRGNVRVRGANPLRLPVVRIQDAHRPRRRLAPRRDFAIGIPHAHFPENLLRRFQCFAGIRIWIVSSEATLPLSHKSPVFLSSPDRLEAAQDLIRRLPVATPGRLQNPIQTWLRHVHAQGIFPVFTTRMTDGHPGAGKRRQNQNQENRKVFHM